MNSKPHSLCERTCLFLACYGQKSSEAAHFGYCIILLGHIFDTKIVLFFDVDSDNDTYHICSETAFDNCADNCETFSFEHSVDIDASKSRNIAIGDIATFANMALSPHDQLAKTGYSLHARDTSVRGMHEAMLRWPLSSWTSLSNL